MGILAEPVQVVMSDLRNLETMKSARLDLIAVFNSNHRLIKDVEQAFGEYNMSGDEKLDDIISQIDRLEKRDLYTPIEQGNMPYEVWGHYESERERNIYRLNALSAKRDNILADFASNNSTVKHLVSLAMDEARKIIANNSAEI